MGRHALLSLLGLAACDAPSAPVHFELDVVVDVGASHGVRVYLRDLDGACCTPEQPWPAAGACTQLTDGFQCHCNEPARFRCLTAIRIEQAGAVVGQTDLRDALSEVAIPGEVAADQPAELIFEGCSADVRVPFVAHSLAAPEVTATREADSASLSWTLPAGATSTAYWSAPELSFVADLCQTVDHQAVVHALPDRPLGLSVMALALPSTTQTPLGLVRVWTASTAPSLSLPPP